MWSLTLCAVALATTGVARSVSGRVRPAFAALAAPACLWLPFAVPRELAGVRAILAVVAFALAMKLVDLATGRRADPEALDHPIRRLIWALVPPDVHFPRGGRDRARAVIDGRRATARLGLKLFGVAVLLALASFLPGLHGHPVAGTLWALTMLYLLLSGAADLGGAVLGLAGLRMAKVFESPILARSPRELWGRRWNRYVSGLAFRHLFVPLDGRRHPLRATAVVFLASGVMHEYLVAAALGRVPERVGWMTAFFALHGMAVIAEMGLGRLLGRRARLPAPIGIALHLGWLVATAPLFLGPLGEIYAYPTWRLF